MKIKHLLLILIPLFIILLNLNILIYNHKFYRLENKDVDENLLDYFKGRENLKFNYTTEESIHLNDVKDLMNKLNFTVYLLVFFILVILIFNKEDLSNILVISGVIAIMITLTFILSDFSHLFTKFHELLFTNDYWLLPEDSLLIKTYPIDFFASFFRRLVLNIMITSLFVISVGIIKNVHKQHKPRSD